MKIFITGITGFVGSHLAEELVKLGHDVYGLARSQKKVDEFEVPGTIIYGDLSSESIQKWSLDLPEDLDAVVHTAGLVHSFNSQDFYAINTVATMELQKKLDHKYSKLHFIFISSLAASKAVSHYGKSKLEAESKLSSNVSKNWQFNIIRPPMVIGPRDPAILDIFQMVKDKIVLFPGLNASKKEYSFVNVFDLVHITIKLIDNPIDLKLLNVSYPKTVTFIKIINLVEKAMDKKAVHLKIPFPLIKIVATFLFLVNKIFKVEARLTPDKAFELKEINWLSNGNEASKLLSYEYLYDFEVSVKMTLVDYIKRGWI